MPSSGLCCLATATSLPELGTGVSTIAWRDEPDLAVGDAFGSNLFNLLIIGLLDLFWRNGPILSSVSIASVMVGALGITIISLAALAMLIHSYTDAMSSWTLSPVSVLILGVFLVAMYLLYRFEQRPRNDGDYAVASSPEEEGGEEQYADESLFRALVIYVLSASCVIGAAIALAYAGDEIAHQMGWQASFVGTQFLAFSTSLPELAACFAAIRINAPELAITGVLGSNLFNMGFILFMDDVALVGAPLWDPNNIASIHSLTAVVAMLMTGVVIAAVVSRGRGRPNKYFTYEGLTLIGLYAGASVLVFVLGD